MFPDFSCLPSLTLSHETEKMRTKEHTSSMKETWNKQDGDMAELKKEMRDRFERERGIEGPHQDRFLAKPHPPHRCPTSESSIAFERT